MRLSQFFDFKFGAGGMIAGNRVAQGAEADLRASAHRAIAARRSAASRPTSPPARRCGCATATSSRRCARPTPSPACSRRCGSERAVAGRRRLVNPVPVSLARALGRRDHHRRRRQCRAPGAAALRGGSAGPGRAARPRREASSAAISGGARAGPAPSACSRARCRSRRRGSAAIRLAEDPPAFVLRPEVGRIGPLEFHRASECIAAGEEAVRLALPALLRSARGARPVRRGRIDRGAALRLNRAPLGIEEMRRCVATARPISPVWWSATASIARSTAIRRSSSWRWTNIFQKVWLYCGHESQVPKRGRLLDRAARPPADGDGAARRRQDPRALQPLPASRRDDLRQPLTAMSARPSPAPIIPGSSTPTARSRASRCPRAMRERGSAPDNPDCNMKHAARVDSLSRLRVREPRRGRADAARVSGRRAHRVRRHVRPRARGRGRDRADLLPRDPAFELEDLPREPARRAASVGDA